jgi:hypothetical protein
VKKWKSNIAFVEDVSGAGDAVSAGPAFVVAVADGV